MNVGIWKLGGIFVHKSESKRFDEKSPPFAVSARMARSQGLERVRSSLAYPPGDAPLDYERWRFLQRGYLVPISFLVSKVPVSGPLLAAAEKAEAPSLQQADRATRQDQTQDGEQSGQCSP